MDPVEHNLGDVTDDAVSRAKGLKQTIKLPRSGRWFRSLVENASDVVMILEADGTIRYVSPAIERMLGYSPEERVGRSGYELLHPDDLARARTTVAEAIRSPGVALTIEIRLRHRDGSWRHVEVTGTNLLGDPSVRGIVLNLRDVTERKEAEEALTEERNLLRTLIDSMPDYIFVKDTESRFLLNNAAHLRALGAEKQEEVVGKTDLDVFPKELAEQYHADERELLRSGRPLVDRHEPVVDLSSGREWLSTTKVPLRNSAGEIVGLVGISRDITERKEAEEAVRESEGRFRALTQNSSDIVTLLRADGTIRYQSPSVERILGYRPEEMLGDNAFGYVHPDDLGRVEVAYAEGLKDPTRRPTVEYRFRHKDGSWRWLESVGSNLLGDPKIGEYVVNSRDVTERKWAEERLREAEERYRTVVEEQTELVCRFRPDLTLTFVNDAYCRYFGDSREWLIGSSFMGHIPVEDHIHYEEHLLRLSKENPTRTVEHRVYTTDGQVRWQQWTDRAIFDEDGRIVEYQSVGRDITERKILEEQLEHLAFHDHLTDLPNRQLFMDRLKQALRRTRRSEGCKVAVLFMDLDSFKVVNDSLGHEVGDGLLVAVGERIGDRLRPEDTLARFGGDEFVVLLEDVEGPEDAVRVAERIVGGLGRPFVVDNRELFVKASVGISLGDFRTKSPDDLLRDADTAMYWAKEEANDYGVFDPAMYERALRRLELENELQRAIEAKEFVVHYQPIVNLQTGGVWGMEALVRWEHPERGLLDPSEFVPVAEKSGFVVPMGERILEEACGQAKAWQEERPHASPLVISANLSARQVQRPDLVRIVEKVLRETGLEPSCLGLDITETVYIKAFEGNTAALDELKRLGVRISIDDFGVGYSSLTYLKRLPADAIKIDKSFIGGLGEDVEDMAIVRMIIDLAHTLGMDAVAEGVESADQAARLKELGCDLAQGFFFSEPLPNENVPEFLAR